MPRFSPFKYLVPGDWDQILLPDFILAVAFFTSLIYAVLGERFSRQRSAALASLTIGIALSIGLVWWEAEHGYSIKKLGPIAVGFAILLLGAVMYRALRVIGGNLAGITLAFGISLLIGWVLGVEWPVEPQILQTVTTVVLLIGVLAFATHRHGRQGWLWRGRDAWPVMQRDMRDLRRDRRVTRQLRRGLRRACHDADLLHEHPEAAGDVMLQLKRMLPAEGYLTQRLARLRQRAHYMRQGHCARIDEIQGAVAKLPPIAKRKISAELVSRYKELKIDVRLERLDKAAAETERRIRELTRAAQRHLQVYDYRKVAGLLEGASKLQKHNARLFKRIERTEAKLVATARHAAKQSHEVPPE